MNQTIRRVCEGDPAAAALLIAQHELRIRLYAAKVAPRPGMAEDVAQKAFLLALQNIARFDPAGDFALWMQGIVRNVARQEWKRLALRSRLERDGLAQYLEEIAALPPQGSPRDEAWLDHLRGCVERLPDRAREIVKLHYSLGITCKDVALRVGTQAAAVKMALVRIRRSLRECITSRLAQETR